MSCNNCGAGNLIPHMVWNGSGFRDGSVRCEACGNIQSTVPVEVAAEEPAAPRRRTRTTDVVTEEPTDG